MENSTTTERTGGKDSSAKRNNNSTSQAQSSSQARQYTAAKIVALVEAATGQPMKRSSGQSEGPCPTQCAPNSGGTDRFYVLDSGKYFCRKCCPDGKDPAAVRRLNESIFGPSKSKRKARPNGQSDGDPMAPADDSNTKPKAFTIPPDAEAHYEYKRDGKLVLGVWRVPDPERVKTFRQALWDGNRYVKNVPYKDLPLYRHDEVMATPDKALIVVAEGEKAADAIHQAFVGRNGEVGTTWAGGTPAVDKTDWKALAGRTVVVWPDKDVPGKTAAEQVVRHLQGCGCTVRMVQVQEEWPEAGDAADLEQAQIRKAVHQSPAALHLIPTPEPDESASEKVSPEALERILKNLGVEFRYNLRSHADEIRGWKSDRWERLGGHREESLRVHISKTYTNTAKPPGHWWITDRKWTVTIGSLLDDNESDPFVEYLEQARIDPESNLTLDNWADRLFKFANKELGGWFCRWAFLAPVQRAYNPACILDEIPVIIGDQDSGKTVLCELLAVEADWQAKIDWSLDSKSLTERITGSVVVEAGEMVGMSKGDYNRAKSWITTKVDVDRWSYGRRAESRKRRSVFIGTANDRCLPNDPSGNRRFVSLPIEPFATPEERDEDESLRIAKVLNDRAVEHLYALAREAFKKGERANLPASLHEARDLANHAMRISNELLEECLDQMVEDNPECVRGFSLREIENTINQGRKIPFYQNLIIDALKLKGWEKGGRKGNTRLWILPEKMDTHQEEVPF